MISPQGRVVMISGAARGIGLAIARSLHGKGYSLSLGARNLEQLHAAVSDYANDRLHLAHFDATDPGSNAAWVAATLERFGRIDGLVNNAGILGPAYIEDEDESALDKLWAVNVKAPMRMIRLTLPHLRKSGQGRIVNVASLSGKRVKNNNAGYAMSKFAVMALTQATRRIGWEDGVRATALCPGMVATDMTAEMDSIAPENMIQTGDLAELVATVMALPNSASVAELAVNCVFEETV